VARHLLVTNDFPPKLGGIQAYLWELWQRLDPETYVVLTASSHPDAAAFDAEQETRGIRIQRVPGRILFFPTPAARARVQQLAGEVGASLVVFDPALPLALLGPSLGIPYGVVLHGAEVAVPGRVPGSRGLLAQVLCRSSLVVSAGGYPAAEAVSAAGIPPATCGGAVAGARPAGPPSAGSGPLRAGSGRPGSAPAGMPAVLDAGPLHVVVPPGVDCGRIVPLRAADRRAARRRLGLPERGPLVASVSRLVPRKGMDVLVEASRRLVPSFPDLTVAIAGQGREAERLAAQVRRTAAPVRLLGALPEEDKAALLGAADVFAMACRDRWAGLEQEGFGIVFLEAAAAGTPQVAGDSGGAADAVEDGVTGLVVRRPGDPGDVALAVRRLLSDDGLRRRMGRAARRRAERAHDYGVLAGRLAGALAEVQG
jgi:phosphatidyl-myo-inositol dimannoside synthase